jgi:hypothetical protein
MNVLTETGYLFPKEREENMGLFTPSRRKVRRIQKQQGEIQTQILKVQQRSAEAELAEANARIKIANLSVKNARREAREERQGLNPKTISWPRRITKAYQSRSKSHDASEAEGTEVPFNAESQSFKGSRTRIVWKRFRSLSGKKQVAIVFCILVAISALTSKPKKNPDPAAKKRSSSSSEPAVTIPSAPVSRVLTTVPLESDPATTTEAKVTTTTTPGVVAADGDKSMTGSEGLVALAVALVQSRDSSMPQDKAFGGLVLGKTKEICLAVPEAGSAETLAIGLGVSAANASFRDQKAFGAALGIAPTYCPEHKLLLNETLAFIQSAAESIK